MARSSEESQKLSFAISGALLLLLSLGYLFVPRADLGDKSPLSVLASPNKEDVFTCEGYSAGELYVPKDDSASEKIKQIQSSPGLEVAIEALSSEDGCRKYSGLWTKVKTDDGSVRTKGSGWSEVGNLISKDLPSTGGLFLLLGASPAIGFLVFQRISGTRSSATVLTTDPPIAKDEKPATSVPSKSVPKELADRLEHLQSLHQKGLITSQEFSTKKKELLEEI
jgi:hypothetical protein